MRDKNIKTLPVADENNHLLGVLSVANLTSCYMDIWDNRILAKSNTTLDNIIDTLSAKVCYVNEATNQFPGKIAVTAMESDTMSEHIEKGDIAIVGDREEAQTELINLNVSLMIVTGGYAPSEKIVNLAKEHGVTVIVTQHDSFTASRLVIQSIPVGYVMVKENIVSFTTDDLVDDIKGIMSETRFRSYPVLDQNGRVVGTVSRYHLISNHKKKVIQVAFTTDDLVDDIKGIMSETRFRSYPVLDQNGRVVGTVSRYHLISNHKKKVIQVDHNERGQSVD